MNPVKKNILITGLPGIGKTTVIKKLSEALNDSHPVGFYTEEIREQGIRKGFELISLDGRKGLLSHVDIKSAYKVGKYNVDIKGFEDFLDSIPFFELFTSIIIIDEIGKMECLSKKFRKLLVDVLDSEKLVVATIALKGGGIIEKVKKRHDVMLFEMKLGNRESLAEEILEEVNIQLR
ncbi:MAG: NTPase [Thermodesulfobacteriota bacterium]